MVGFSTTNFTRAWEPTLSWNQLRSLTRCERKGDFTTTTAVRQPQEKVGEGAELLSTPSSIGSQSTNWAVATFWWWPVVLETLGFEGEYPNRL